MLWWHEESQNGDLKITKRKNSNTYYKNTYQNYTYYDIIYLQGAIKEDLGNA